MIFHINLKVILTLNVNLSRILIRMTLLSSVSWVRQSPQLSYPTQDTTLAGVNSNPRGPQELKIHYAGNNSISHKD